MWLPSISWKRRRIPRTIGTPAPEKQFVITLSGTLEFVTPDGEKFVVRPGDVLLAEDNAGEGHKWRHDLPARIRTDGDLRAQQGSSEWALFQLNETEGQTPP